MMTIKPRSALLRLIAMSALWITVLACSEEETKDAPNPGGLQGPCSVVEPTIGTQCATPMTCRYGDTVRPECRTNYNCNKETGWLWKKTPDCEQPPTGYCPATRPEATSCIVEPNVACEYGNVICLCPCNPPYEDGGCAPAVWRCFEPPATEGCPAIAPNYGTPCSIQGLECNYGNVCDWGASLLCFRGVWLSGSFNDTFCAK
jgi:hypothetical protein